MPCSDVTEVLSITLDPDDRIIHYSLIKDTCGGAVGNSSLLRRWVENKPASEVMAAQPEEVMAAVPTKSTTWEFLTLKHLFALQTGLQAFLGEKSATTSDSCVVDTVESTPKGIQFIALIKVDVLTEKIESCGGCGSCGSKGSSAAPEAQP